MHIWFFVVVAVAVGALFSCAYLSHIIFKCWHKTQNIYSLLLLLLLVFLFLNIIVIPTLIHLATFFSSLSFLTDIWEEHRMYEWWKHIQLNPFSILTIIITFVYYLFTDHHRYYTLHYCQIITKTTWSAHNKVIQFLYNDRFHDFATFLFEKKNTHTHSKSNYIQTYCVCAHL